MALEPTARQAMGTAGRERVVSQYNLFTETAKLKGLFDRLAR